ncbi:hypothetical protein GOV12_07845 [Candidatus Pacearchaeota archaeon]|nr:hypothetical protein [Candidatus Pacearchaeota archaeon]
MISHLFRANLAEFMTGINYAKMEGIALDRSYEEGSVGRTVQRSLNRVSQEVLFTFQYVDQEHFVRTLESFKECIELHGEHDYSQDYKRRLKNIVKKGLGQQNPILFIPKELDKYVGLLLREDVLKIINPEGVLEEI